jgi:CDP-diacylglycerol--serine O-phosphatidyltransferase
MNVDPPIPQDPLPLPPGEGRDEGARQVERLSVIPHPLTPPLSGREREKRNVDRDDDVYRSRAHRRRRLRRRRRRAYIRSVYFLPSLATLGNAVCGFGAMYVAAFDAVNVGDDPWAKALLTHKFLAAAYLIILAMVFDALDGRLARFARHTTDFGGQLDSLADAVSFGAAPAFIALLLFKAEGPEVPFAVSRLIWAMGAVYFSCAAIRLARFNVSNEHGEQHHFSFLGLPSPGAAAAVVGVVLIQQDLSHLGYHWSRVAAEIVTYLLPLIVLGTGLLMVSAIRYPHLVNRYLRGRRSVARLVGVLAVLMIVIFQHRYAFGIGSLLYALYGPVNLAFLRLRPKPPGAPGPTAPAGGLPPSPAA